MIYVFYYILLLFIHNYLFFYEVFWRNIKYNVYKINVLYMLNYNM